MNTEHRRFIRKSALHLLDYLIIDEHGLQTTYSMARTLDVSENGLKLEAAQQINIGDSLLITVGLENDLIDLRGDVVHVEKSNDRFLTGIEFRDISENGRRILKKYAEAFRNFKPDGQ